MPSRIIVIRRCRSKLPDSLLRRHNLRPCRKLRRVLRRHRARQRCHPRLQRRNLRLPDGPLRLHSPRQLRLDLRHHDRLLKQRRPNDLPGILPAQLAPVSGLRGLLQEVGIVEDLLQGVGIAADLLQEALLEAALLPDAMEVLRIGAAMTRAGAEEAAAPGVEAWAPETCPEAAVALAAEACPGVVVEILISHFSGTTDSATRCSTGSTILTMITR